MPEYSVLGRQENDCRRLLQVRFLPGYEVWTFHDEKATQVIEKEEEEYSMGVDRMDKMLGAIEIAIPEDPPTMEVEGFHHSTYGH
jgi:hypothetical protein